MTEKQNAEMLELAAELEGCLALPYLGIPSDVKFVAGFAMTAANRDLIVAALHAAAPSPHPRGEPVAYAITDPEFGDYLTWSKAAAESAGHGFQPLYAAPQPTTREELVCKECEERERIHRRFAGRKSPRLPDDFYFPEEDAAPPPAGADAVREALKPFAAVAEYDIGETESDADIYRPMSKNNRAPLLTVGDLRRAYAALLPAPPPQEKPTGDQT